MSEVREGGLGLKGEGGKEGEGWVGGWEGRMLNLQVKNIRFFYFVIFN